ncbi:hypothetical protein PsorP6_004969 [Peronosclerospora sorghi]|uniref:Uncharacterized protein n=1 Tax=Peronosclerospora sorghi TaxID=230839 RepID=A0ACC0W847_9STRA|nr:hypothetical protein PsorP6_004969 [Peronosclerospora sorghi]
MSTLNFWPKLVPELRENFFSNTRWVEMSQVCQSPTFDKLKLYADDPKLLLMIGVEHLKARCPVPSTLSFLLHIR